MKDKICFKIYAYEEIEKKGKKGIPNRDEILRSHVNFEENEKDNNATGGDNKSPKKPTNRMTRFKTVGNLRKDKSSNNNEKPNKTSSNNDKDKDCLIY